MKTLTVLLAVTCTLLLPTAGMGNEVLRFLTNVEVQFEGEAQKENIETALVDVLKLSTAELRKQKYPNYSGDDKAWDLRELLVHHFVPDEKGKSLGEDFYSELETPEVQTRFREILRDLRKGE